MLPKIQERLDEEWNQSILFCVHGQADSFMHLVFNNGEKHLSNTSLHKGGVKQGKIYINTLSEVPLENSSC